MCVNCNLTVTLGCERQVRGGSYNYIRKYSQESLVIEFRTLHEKLNFRIRFSAFSVESARGCGEQEGSSTGNFNGSIEIMVYTFLVSTFSGKYIGRL